MTLYESIFIVHPNTDETALQEIVQSVQTFIESNGGNVKHTDNWGRKKLAYRVKHQSEGYFVLILFEAPVEMLSELYRQYQIMEGIVKSMVVRFEGDLAKAMETRATPAPSTPSSELIGEDAPAPPPVATVVESDALVVPVTDADETPDNNSSEEE